MSLLVLLAFPPLTKQCKSSRSSTGQHWRRLRLTIIQLVEAKAPFWRALSVPSLSSVPRGLQSMTVHVLNEGPVHAMPDSVLVLKARIEHGPLEDVSVVTWQREPETGVAPKTVTLATCPGRRHKCANTRPNVHVTVKQQETTLQINGYSSEDSGVYAVTVMDYKGAKTTAHCIVRIYGTVWYTACEAIY